MLIDMETAKKLLFGRSCQSTLLHTYYRFFGEFDWVGTRELLKEVETFFSTTNTLPIIGSDERATIQDMDDRIQSVSNPRDAEDNEEVYRLNCILEAYACSSSLCHFALNNQESDLLRCADSIISVADCKIQFLTGDEANWGPIMSAVMNQQIDIIERIKQGETNMSRLIYLL